MQFKLVSLKRLLQANSKEILITNISISMIFSIQYNKQRIIRALTFINNITQFPLWKKKTHTISQNLAE